MWKRWFWAGRRDQKRTCCQQQQRSNVKRRNGNATTMAAVRCKCGNNIIKQQPQRRLHPNLHIQHPPTPLAFYVPCIYHGHNSKPLLRRPFSPPCHPIHLDWPTVICVCEILTTIFHCAHHCCNGRIPFLQQPYLFVKDAGANILVADSSSYCTVSISNNPSGGLLSSKPVYYNRNEALDLYTLVPHTVQVYKGTVQFLNGKCDGTCGPWCDGASTGTMNQGGWWVIIVFIIVFLCTCSVHRQSRTRISSVVHGHGDEQFLPLDR